MSNHPPEGDADFQKSDRSARLLRTLRYVEAAGEAGIRPEDLAKKLGVSRRTAYRDLQALEASVGVPVWNNLGRWGVSQEGLLPELRFSKDEAISVVLAARLLAKFSTGYDPELGAALMKLGSLLENPLRSAVERTVTQLSLLTTDSDARERLRLLTTAWVTGRIVEFDYAAAWSNPGTSRRARVHPYLMEPSAATHTTYLIGHDETRNALRTFRVDRISNVRIGRASVMYPSPTASAVATRARIWWSATAVGLSTPGRPVGRRLNQFATEMKSSLVRTPQSGQHQSTGIRDQAVPGRNPSRASPTPSS